MADISVSFGISVGGVSSSGTNTRDCDSQIGHDPEVPAGQAGTLTTRTDNDTGVITLDDAAVPTVTTSDTVCVFWDGGYRYGCTVTAVGATTVTVDVGTGTNLPVLTTAVVVAKEVTVDTDLDGDLVKVFTVSLPGGGDLHFRILDATGTATTVLVNRLDAGEVVAWNDSSIFTNPFAAADINSVVVAQDGLTAVDLAMGFGYDSTV